MKLITAMIRSDKLEAVQTAITGTDAYVTCISDVWDVRDPIAATYRGRPYLQPRPRMRMEIVVVNDRLAQDVVDAIAKAASISDLERIGSGNIFVSTLEQWLRIPTGVARAASELEAVGGRPRRTT